jgi:hypothetical protein
MISMYEILPFSAIYYLPLFVDRWEIEPFFCAENMIVISIDPVAAGQTPTSHAIIDQLLLPGHLQ